MPSAPTPDVHCFQLNHQLNLNWRFLFISYLVAWNFSRSASNLIVEILMLRQHDSMSLSEVGAAVLVLLGIAPPASLPPESSSKVKLINLCYIFFTMGILCQIGVLIIFSCSWMRFSCPIHLIDLVLFSCWKSEELKVSENLDVTEV